MDTLYILLIFLSLYYIFKFRKYMYRTQFYDKTVWITGASSGIGECLAYEFSRLGARVILSARNLSELERVAKRCREITIHTDPDTIRIIPLDLSDSDTTMNTIRTALKSTQVDILVNNAGMSQRSTCLETCESLTVEKKVFELNVFGTFAATKAILPHFVAKKSGQIVVINSVSGLVGVPVRTSYCASKFALVGYFEALRAELAEYNISVTNIYPGYVRTNVSKNAINSEGSKFGKTDSEIENGMDPTQFAREAVRGIFSKEKELIIAPFKLRAAVFLKSFCPAALRWMLEKRAKHQLETRAKAK